MPFFSISRDEAYLKIFNNIVKKIKYEGAVPKNFIEILGFLKDKSLNPEKFFIVSKYSDKALNIKNIPTQNIVGQGTFGLIVKKNE